MDGNDNIQGKIYGSLGRVKFRSGLSLKMLDSALNHAYGLYCYVCSFHLKWACRLTLGGDAKKVI
jgi:hypothetical protein